jgi:hypothetical protein
MVEGEEEIRIDAGSGEFVMAEDQLRLRQQALEQGRNSASSPSSSPSSGHRQSCSIPTFTQRLLLMQR